MRFSKKEEGQGLVEYALLLVLVAIVIIVILALMGRAVTTVYAQVLAGLNGQTLDGEGTEYVVTGVGVVVGNSPPECGITVSGTIIVFEDGQLAEAGINVSGSATWPGGSGSVQGTTDSNGTAVVSGAGGTGNCSGSATITDSNDSNSKTVNYSN